MQAGSRAARGRLTVHATPNRLNYCVISAVHTQFTNVAVGLIIQAGGPRVGDQRRNSVSQVGVQQRGVRGSERRKCVMAEILLAVLNL